eukprot:1182818-Prorocentrum_minimum.AAC.6
MLEAACLSRPLGEQVPDQQGSTRTAGGAPLEAVRVVSAKVLCVATHAAWGQGRRPPCLEGGLLLLYYVRAPSKTTSRRSRTAAMPLREVKAT